MLKMALVGLGGMGRGHLSAIEDLIKNGVDIELVALCDINPSVFGKVETTLNIEGLEKDEYDFSKYHIYYNVDDMLANEKDLDFVNVVIPTYDHCKVACKIMNAGINCLCEKPMALNLEDCELMLDTAKKNNVQLMMGLCERFNPWYATLKKIIDTNMLGKAVGAYLYRGGSKPGKDWFFDETKSGGAIIDQHVHDVDLVNYLYGMPKAVSTVGKNVIEGAGFDTSSTNYVYDDLCVHTANRWIAFKPGFVHSFTADFEEGTVVLEGRDFQVYDKNMKRVEMELVGTINDTTPYYQEIEYFANIIKTGAKNTVNPPEDTVNSMRIAFAEVKSAELNGQVVEI